MKISDKIKHIDTHYAVEDIKVNGMPFWPFLKVFYFDSQFVTGGTQTTFSFIEKVKMIRGIFYGFRNWFGKADYLVFSNSDQRKIIDGLWVDKSADFLHKKFKNALHIELPVFAHKPRKQVYYKRVVSHLPLRILENILGKVNRNVTIQGGDVWKSILLKEGGKADINVLGMRFYSQFKVMSLLLKIYRPKKVFMVVPYMKMGYVYACRKNKVEVIEMQHGVINRSHFGYCNFKQIDECLYPNQLLSYGHSVKQVFGLGNITFERSKVHEIGHYYLWLIAHKKKELKAKYRKQYPYKTIVSASLQDDSIGHKLVPFLHEVAQKFPSILFVFSPRKTTIKEYKKMGLAENIMFFTELNVYEVIAISDVHITAFSTCALEAPVLGVANILYNVENKAVEFFSEMLIDDKVNRYVNSVDEFKEAMDILLNTTENQIKKSVEHVIAENFDANFNLWAQKCL